MHGLWYRQSPTPCIKWQEEKSNTQLSVSPLSCPSKKNAAQTDVTTDTALKSGLRKTQQISK
jgi:hypothetical protein